MRGEYRHNIDAKGRMIFPIRLREALGEHAVIFRGMDHCLTVFSEEQWNHLQEKVNAMPISVGRDIRRFYAANYELEPDAQGRIVVPPILRQYADLEKEVTIIGMMDRVEIWNTAAWEKYNEELDQKKDALMATMDALGV